MQWSIPQPSGTPLAIELEAGEQIFVVGPNGSGKSALLQHLAASSGGGKIRRIFAHRQTWLNSGSLTLTPESRRQFERDRSGRETANDAIWRDRWGADTHAAVLFDLVAAENKRARSIAGHVENSKIECAKKAANAASPFTRLNELLALGTLRVSLHNPDDVEIVARKGSGPTFGIERMSDGERNAVIMAATVLTVDPGTTLLIDEPERHLHRAIIAPFLSALFEQRRDCAFVVSTHELFLPVESSGARVLMTRSCTWAGDNSQAWDVEILAQPAELPEKLRLAVLGARSRVLFVEGSSTSLDLPLYDNLFPELSVSPCGNCVEVERAVRGLRATEDRHHVEAYGIVDRDELDDAGKREADAFLSWLRKVGQAHRGRVTMILSGSVSLEPLLEQAGLSAQANIFSPYDLKPWSEETAVSCLEALAGSYGVGLAPESCRDMCRRLRCCIPHHVQMFFDRMHDHLRRAGRRDASLDDVEWVYVREMQGVRGQVDLQHYEGRLETVLGRAGYTVALEILTATAVDGGIAAETVDRYRNHFSTRDAQDGDGAPSVHHVLHVLQHDGYLEPEDDGYRFVSGLLEDWWRGRYGQRFVHVFDRQR